MRCVKGMTGARDDFRVSGMPCVDYKPMIRAPNSANLWGNFGPGHDMNMSEVGMPNRWESAATLEGVN